MPVLRVNQAGVERSISLTPGLSLRETLHRANVHLRSTCGGAGVCGRCRVLITYGRTNAPTARETARISPDDLARGVRLACQVRPEHDIGINTQVRPEHDIGINTQVRPEHDIGINTQVRPEHDIGITVQADVYPSLSGPAGHWRSLADDEYAPVDISPMPDAPPYGAAVDIGSTQIRVSIWDMRSGRRIAGRIGLNPQSYFGADILTRLAAAAESPDNARLIRMAAREAVGEALQDMAQAHGLNLREVGQVVIVGNTAMLALLSGRNHGLLLNPDNWERTIDCSPDDTPALRELWGVAESAIIDIVQPVAGFVGSDLLADIIATKLAEGPDSALLIDFGTNSEIALWDGREILVASTAGGPAFEGGGIGCGMPAEPGAIFRVEQDEASGAFHHETIGGGEPEGICGSGLVDILACLIRSGELRENGKFLHHHAGGRLQIVIGRTDMVLTTQDIDALQRAKAAIAAATTRLMKLAGMHPEKLRRVCVCGAFGRYLDVRNAQFIGLLPGIADDTRVEHGGNSALAGCEALLFASDRAAVLRSVAGKANHYNMSTDTDFEELFIDSLFLRPMRWPM
ncbi:MAG: DUF4445 domain-containing protein [Nitrospirae bacterium]|nr:DUF4445 domain-containing protein [Nitrospirota bacterium]